MKVCVLLLDDDVTFHVIIKRIFYHFIVDEHSVAGHSLEEVIQGGSYLALSPGDKIVGFEESGADAHIILSGEEHYQPT